MKINGDKVKKVEINLVYNYIYNNRQRLEEELRNQQAKLRYRKIDVVDCIETACVIERLNTFRQMSCDILQLLKLVELEEINENKKTKFEEL